MQERRERETWSIENKLWTQSPQECVGGSPKGRRLLKPVMIIIIIIIIIIIKVLSVKRVINGVNANPF